MSNSKNLFRELLLQIKIAHYKKYLALVLVLAGYAFLFRVDWRIALGVFLVHWVINLEHART